MRRTCSLSILARPAQRCALSTGTGQWSRRLPPGFSMTKIVATIGPVSEQAAPLQQCVDAGMNIMRINCSHATYDEIEMRVKNLRDAKGISAKRLDGKPSYALQQSPANNRSILLDTQGPEIRTGFLAPDLGDTVELTQGSQITLTTDDAYKHASTAETLFVTFDKMAETVEAGDSVLLDDGLISLEVLEVRGDNEVLCCVTDGGALESKRGVNLPGLTVDLPAMSDKDREDIRFGLELDIDFVAASFIRKAADVNEVRDFVDKAWKQIWHGHENRPPPQIISKVENAEALDNFDEILHASDGIMVARGDLGVEIPFEKVSTAQKEMVRKCNAHGKPVIVATQMLESMQHNPRPTRAEVADVANAVYDGADCVMLSGESAKGKYFQESIAAMKACILEADHWPQHNRGVPAEHIEAVDTGMLNEMAAVQPDGNVHGMAASAVKAADTIGAACIIVLTKSGSTARYVAQCRPNVPIVAFTCKLNSIRARFRYPDLYAFQHNCAQSAFVRANFPSKICTLSLFPLYR